MTELSAEFKQGQADREDHLTSLFTVLTAPEARQQMHQSLANTSAQEQYRVAYLALKALQFLPQELIAPQNPIPQAQMALQERLDRINRALPLDEIRKTDDPQRKLGLGALCTVGIGIGQVETVDEAIGKVHETLRRTVCRSCLVNPYCNSDNKTAAAPKPQTATTLRAIQRHLRKLNKENDD